MSSVDSDDDDIDPTDDYRDDLDLEDGCGGTGYRYCFCGGDQCVCGEEMAECLGCEDCDREGYDQADDYDPEDYAI